MQKSLITALIILLSLSVFGQTKETELLEKFNKCDSTLSNFDVMSLIYHYRDIDKMNLNDGLLEVLQKLEQDSSFLEMEKVCSKILKENPVNLTASFYYTVSQLRLDKLEDIELLWNKTEWIYSAIDNLGKGTEYMPYVVSDLNDAKALIYLFRKEGTTIDSLANAENGIVNIFITNTKGIIEINRFNFDKNLPIRELFFDYHRDFQYYLSESKSPESQYFYETLLNRFQAHDFFLKNNEILALMIGFTDNENYHPYMNTEIEREIMKLVNNKDFKKSLDLSEEILLTNPLNFTATMKKGFALMKTKDDKSYFPSKELKMIVDAVMWSGDGSKAHPYFVLSPIDGQTIIRYIYRNSIGIMGSGYDSNGYFLDIIEMEEEDSEAVTLHFNIDHAMNNSEMKKEIDEALKNVEE